MFFYELSGFAFESSCSYLGEHIPCEYSMLTIWVFDHIENKHTLYCGKDCMTKFCESLRKHAENIIDFEKKILPLTKEGLKSNQDAKVCYICGKGILKKLSESINYRKVRDHCHLQVNIKVQQYNNISNLKFNVPNEIPVVFQNDSNCDYHFVIKESANKFKGKSECLKIY